MRCAWWIQSAGSLPVQLQDGDTVVGCGASGGDSGAAGSELAERAGKLTAARSAALAGTLPGLSVCSPLSHRYHARCREREKMVNDG